MAAPSAAAAGPSARTLLAPSGASAQTRRCKFDETSGRCVDRNECATNNPCDPTNGICVDLHGGYQCLCKPGFQAGADGRSCEDIDECALALHRCPLGISVCENTSGGFRCACDEALGFTTSRFDPRTCENLNECERWPSSICGDLECCKDLDPILDGAPFQCARREVAGRQARSTEHSPARVPYHRRGPLGLLRGAEAEADASPRRLQLFGLLAPRASCPSGFIDVVDISIMKSRVQAIENFRGALSGPNRVRPDRVAAGISNNAGVVSKEVGNWYSAIASVPGSLQQAATLPTGGGGAPVAQPMPQYASQELGPLHRVAQSSEGHYQGGNTVAASQLARPMTPLSPLGDAAQSFGEYAATPEGR
eukprot:Polyplicarium_translucidae@DN2142_c0_g1_i2.p1